MSNAQWLENLCIHEVNLVNKYTAQKGDYPMKNGGRRHHGFLYTVEGTEMYHFADKTLSAVPESVIYIPKGEKYSIELNDEQSVVIAFDFEMEESAKARPFCIKLGKNPVLKSQFGSAETQWRSKKSESQVECKACFYKIIAALIKNEAYYSSTQNRQKISSAVSYLHLHYLENDFKVSKLAVLAEMSPRYFETLFFNEFKTTPKEYVLSLKLELAKELLLSEKNSVTDVAYQLGYSDIYQFSKFFKAKTGYTPSEYRRNTVT